MKEEKDIIQLRDSIRRIADNCEKQDRMFYATQLYILEWVLSDNKGGLFEDGTNKKNIQKK